MKRLNVENLSEEVSMNLRAELRVVLEDRLKIAVTQCRDYGLDGSVDESMGEDVITTSSQSHRRTQGVVSTHSATTSASSQVGLTLNAFSMGKKNKVHPYPTNIDHSDSPPIFGLDRLDSSPGRPSISNLDTMNFSAPRTSISSNKCNSNGKSSQIQLSPLVSRKDVTKEEMLFDELDNYANKDKELEQMMSIVSEDTPRKENSKMKQSSSELSIFKLNEYDGPSNHLQSLDDMIAEFSLD